MEHHLTGTRLGATEPLTNASQRKRARVNRPRSAVTSGRTLFIGGDPNSAWARRFADLVVGHVVDAGGRDAISEAQFALCKRAAGLEAECEKMEARLSQGEDVDLDRYGRAASHLRRILESIGLERKAKDITRLPLRQRLTLEAEEAA
jgi:hypothetical protein